MSTLARFYTGTNRIADRIPLISERCDALEPGAREAFEREMDVTLSEHFAYQTAQSRAFALERITQDEALLIYAALGEYREDGNGGWTAGTDLATKVAVTLAVGEII